MTSLYLKQLNILLKRLLICYLLYFFSRFVFYAGNLSFFQGISFLSFVKTCFYGLRFDSFSIVISNSLFILLSIVPSNLFNRNYYQKTLFVLFIICNSIFLAVNFIDVAYLPFIKKRSTAEIFDQLAGQSDMAKLLPRFLIDFWWVFVLYFISLGVMIFLYRRIKIDFKVAYGKAPVKQWLVIVFLFVLCGGISTLFARGGLQRVPIDVVNAGAVAEPEEVPIVLNSSFTIVKSISQNRLAEYHFYNETDVKNIYNPVHYFKDSTLKKQNVVVLILESFSKEYTKLGRVRSITPFLDSLMDKSLVFGNAFSNGTKSIEGIPAILSSLPSLMENPFINSVYANNFQTSFANLLKKEGYESAFFHGGINGTMNFTDWAPAAGYDYYFGRNEYGNEADFDGYWGIWDEPFLQFSVKKMSEFKIPFHSAIFTLSSHHPYFVPTKYKNKFPKTNLENSESIGYADYALRLFFESAKKTDWYANTLFILTADHCGISEDHFFANPVGNLSIPILFFKPDNSLVQQNNRVFSQMDILPSAMSLLGYNKKFFAFGRSYNSQNKSASCFYQQGSHYLYGDSLVSIFNSGVLTTVYNYYRDSVLTQNLVSKNQKADSTNSALFKAFIQTYNNVLIHNLGRIN